MASNKTLFRFFILFVAALTLSACVEPPRQYSAEAIMAKVVDADTKKPIEGVIVTANWQLERGTVGGNVPVGQIMVMETVSDKDGKFTFPAWGPKWAFGGHLVIKDPQLLLFKGGYEYRGLQNAVTTHYNKGSLRHSEWNGKTIEMKKFKDHSINVGANYSTSAYAENLSFLSTSLTTIIENDCNWKKIPQILLALKTQAEIFRKNGIRESLVSADYIPTSKRQCGSPEEFFRNYQR
jgi:hypothetical protein